VVDLLRFEQLVVQALPGWSADGFEVTVHHSRHDLPKRSIWINLRRSGSEIELGVWDSGEAELAYTSAAGDIQHEHFEGLFDSTAENLLQRLDEASEMNR